MRNTKEARLVFLFSRALVRSPGAITPLSRLIKSPSPVPKSVWWRDPLAVPHQPKMTSSSSQQPRSLVTLQLDEILFFKWKWHNRKNSCASPMAPPAVNSHQQEGVFSFAGKGTQRTCYSSFVKPRIPVGLNHSEVQRCWTEPRGLSSSLSSRPWVLGHWKGDVGNVPGAQFWNTEAWRPWRSYFLKEN